jgi:peptide/nickel transport system permease protein
MRRTFQVDPTQRIPVGFFVHGVPYKFLGLLTTDRHLFGPVAEGQPMYLLGADRLGRDLCSRLILGTRTSMTIGLVGVAFSLVLGILLGGLSGYYGGLVDTLIQSWRRGSTAPARCASSSATCCPPSPATSSPPSRWRSPA